MYNPNEDRVFVKKVLILLTFFGSDFSSQSVHRNMWNIDGVESEYNMLLNNYESAYTVNTSGCSVPKMKHNDRTVKEYIHYPQSVQRCPSNHHPLLQGNRTHICVDKQHFNYYEISNPSKLKCCYRSFHQITSHEVHRLKHETMYMECITFKKCIRASHEFVKVECYYLNKVIYDQFFLFALMKNYPGRNEFYRRMDEATTFNVMIIGLSSVSRLNAQRSMPNTMNLLKKLGSIEFAGYHSIGNGTLENIVPILTGMSTRELIATCRADAQHVLDSCPYIWEMFKNVGYFTALVQDTARSAIFDSDMYGFSAKPADYFVHPFIKESETPENFTKLRDQGNKFLRFLNNETKTYLGAHKLCVGDRYYFSFVLDYIEMLTDILRSSKLFGFFWESSLSHSLNAPVLMDDEYVGLLTKLLETGYLNNTILLMLSDEGFPRGGIETTKLGQLERRLPLLSILMPPAFRERYRIAYETLKINRNRLTTPFDLHETLTDLTELNHLENDELISRGSSDLVYERGMSLFVPIPENRTCVSAGINNKWCTCHRSTELNTHTVPIRKAVKYINTHLNWLLRYYPRCAKLVVRNVTEAAELWPSYSKETQWREFRIRFIVSPGDAEFEAVLRRDHREWTLLGPIRRLDVVTNPGICLKDDFIKWYCQCVEMTAVSTTSTKPTTKARHKMTHIMFGNDEWE